ncbi:MAG: gamma carbonic anhydrase family protein [Microthrixaceae bacterium]
MAIYALGDQEPRIHPDAYVHPDAVVIGSVTIGARSSVWPTAVLRGDDGEIVIGEETSVQDGSILHTTPMWPTVLGDRVTIGHNAHLEACTIEDRALVGSGSIVLHRAVVGREAIVGAGAFVGNNKRVPPLAMALGVPAVIREDAVEPGHFDHGVDSYVNRAARYVGELRRLDP